MDPPFDDPAAVWAGAPPAVSAAAPHTWQVGVAQRCCASAHPAAPGSAAAPMLPFDWPARGPQPASPVTGRQPRARTRPGATLSAPPPPGAPGHHDGPLRQPSPGQVAARRFAGVCVEVLSGHRPASHLRAVTAPASLVQVTDQIARRTPRTYLSGSSRPVREPSRVRLRTVRVCEPRDGVAELAAVLEYRGRSWAMAARLELHHGTWLCTLVQVL